MYFLNRKYHYFILLSAGFIFLNCNKSSRVIIPVAQIPIENTPIIIDTNNISKDQNANIIDDSNDLNHWIINKKSLGPIQVGMSIRSVDSILANLEKQVGQALDFGFGGGSPAYVYLKDSTPILAIVQSLNSKKVFAIVAISDIFHTSNGLHPQMKVSKLLEVYPQMKFYLDNMNGWEYASDDLHQWYFIFNTDPANRIGTYTSEEKPSVAKKTTAINSWITIQ